MLLFRGAHRICWRLGLGNRTARLRFYPNRPIQLGGVLFDSELDCIFCEKSLNQTISAPLPVDKIYGVNVSTHLPFYPGSPHTGIDRQLARV